jgi:hypothetical protein
MVSGLKLDVAQFRRAVLLFILSLPGISVVNAATIPAGDSMGVGGTYSVTGSLADSNWTLTLGNTVEGGNGLGVFGPGSTNEIDFFDSGTVNTTTIDLDSFSPITNLFEIDGWQVGLDTLVINEISDSVMKLDGTGFITGNDYTKTAAVWDITGNTDGSTYSMTITAVPVPAAVWLFGSGLVGLITVARRKAA